MTKTFANSTVLRRLRGVELAQLAAALIFAIAVFLPWYSTNGAVVGSNIHGHRGDVSAWIAHPIMRWLLLAAAAGGLLSAWQTLAGETGTRGVHRGETSVVVALTAAVLVLFVGLIDRPGSPSSGISLATGWFVALGAALVAVWAATARLPKPARKPPGI